MQKLRTYWPEIIFFLLTLLLGLITHWGKANVGQWSLNWHYIDQNGSPLVPYKILNSTTLCFVFFWIGTVFSYLFSFEIFKSRKWSLIATIIFYSIPILPGLSFFDVVNIPLFAWMMIGLFLLVKFIQKPSYLIAFLLAFFHTMAIFSHPIALMIPIVTLLFFILNFFTRNLLSKDFLKALIYILALLVLWIFVRLGLNYPLFMQHRDFLPSSWFRPWYSKIEWCVLNIPPLWLVYFVFAIVSLNIVYFTNYFTFLKQKWIYTFLFCLLILFIIAHLFMPVNVLMLQERYVYILPSIVIIGVGGCYEFSLWVRRRWGEKVYFIFKYTFLIVFALQCLWIVIAMVWLHPEYYLYRNWPIWWVK